MAIYARNDQNNNIELLDFPYIPGITDGLIECSNFLDLAGLKKNPAFYKIDKGKIAKKKKSEIDKILSIRTKAKEKQSKLVSMVDELDNMKARLEKAEQENKKIPELVQRLEQAEATISQLTDSSKTPEQHD